MSTMKAALSTADAIKQIRSLQGESLVQSLCLAVLGFTQDSAENPFNALFVDECACCGPRLQFLYKDMATLFLNKMERAREQRDQQGVPEWMRTDGYISLEEYISTRADWPANAALPEHLFLDPTLEALLYEFFQRTRYCLDEGILDACRLVYHGVPLYRQGPDGTSFTRLPDSDADASYISRKYMYRETNAAARQDAEWSMPEWAGRLYFKRADFDHYLSFYGRRADVSEVAAEALRAALRSKLGIEPALSAKDGDHAGADYSAATPLMKMVDKVLRRDCPGVFKADGTWPGQEAVAVWLQQHAGLSERAARAVSLVTQPKP